MQHFLLLVSLLSSCQAFAVHGNRWGPRSNTALESSATDQEHIVKLTEEENKIKTCDVLSLESIRSTLIRQEETIIFALIERSQFRRNDIVYKRGGFGDLGSPMGSTPVDDDDDTELSFLEYFLVGTVCIETNCALYTVEGLHAERSTVLNRKYFTVA